jgi:hypothetical protein
MKKQLIEGVDYYLTEGGLMVFTERFHREKGFCCGNGCRHCPYDYADVPEPLKTQLLTKRKEVSEE